MCSTFQKIIAYREYVMSRRNKALYRFNDAVILNDNSLIEQRYSRLMIIEKKWQELNTISS